MEEVHAVDVAWLQPGTEIGPWRVVRGGGEGVYGVVYRVERVGDSDRRPFAMKLARYPRDPRFEREAGLLSRIHHPLVPRLHDRGEWTTPDGEVFPYLVMDWVEGVPLYAWAARHPLSSRKSLRLLSQVASALAAVHAVEAVHRDVKGDNVLVRKEDGKAVLMDFGSGNYRGASILTRKLPPPGTPQYQSPESQRFEVEHFREAGARYEAQPSDDVYALGMMAYRLVTGRYPPPTLRAEQTQESTRLRDLPLVPPEQWVTLSPELGSLIRQMLSEKPSSRGSAREVAEALECAAEVAEAEADQLITPRLVQALNGPDRVPTAPARAAGGTPREPSRAAQRPVAGRERFIRWQVVLAGALGFVAAVGMLQVVQVRGSEPPFSEEQRVEAAQETHDRDLPDAEAAGLAETVSAVPMEITPHEAARSGISLEMPKKPFPGQRLPPCEKPEIELSGGCWVRLGDASPPCGGRSYEWNKGCYLPMFVLPKPPTSGQPQDATER